MSHKKILLIGSEGELGKKITNEFDFSQNEKDSIIKIDLYNLNQIDQLISPHEYVSALIATPPSTHFDYTEKLLKNSKIQKIISEKPYPIEKDSIDKIKDDSTRLFILDHYLFKHEIPNIINYYNKNKENISEIHLSILEENIEKRKWMKSKDEFGGVIYDLGHHLVAILYKLFENSLFTDIENLTITNSIYFNNDPASSDKEIVFDFNIQNHKIICHIGKETNKVKKMVSFIHKNKSQKNFQLYDKVNYKPILTEESSQKELLTFEISIKINEFLKKILDSLEEQSIYRTHIRELSDNTALQLLTSFNDEFKHRHTFYWASYYKFLISYVLVLLSPLLMYYFILELKKETEILAFDGVSMIIILLSFFLDYYILKKLLPKTKHYLEDEDLRLKIPINRMREIYYLKFNVNTYPNQNLKLNNSLGLGSNYMFQHIKFICKTIAIIVPILLIIITYINSNFRLAFHFIL